MRGHDLYLNDASYWRNVPARVWDYTIGGYQVIKKWLSYREAKLPAPGPEHSSIVHSQFQTMRLSLPPRPPRC